MSTYQLVTTPAAAKSIKKLPPLVRSHLKTVCTTLGEKPYLGEKLHGSLKFLYSLHARYKNTDYRVIYEVDETQHTIIIRYAGPRENFYNRLTRLKLKPLS